MREFVRYIAGFSLVVLSAAVVLLTGFAATLLAAPQLLLQTLYYGVIFLCIAAALAISFILLHTTLSKG